MSFKREGNDSNQLGILRKRRVRDLLGLAVPDDEALLMSNGRFACLVCGHRPVFDTVDMLILHRGGKKHLASEEYQAEKKDELEKLIQKRKHEQYLKDGTTSISQAKDSHKGLGMGLPYDPRSKKPRVHDRKQKLDLTSSDIPEPTATCSSALPGNQSYETSADEKIAYQPKNQSSKSGGNMTNQSFRELLLHEQLQHGPVRHPKQLKCIFGGNKPKNEVHDYKPYVGRKKNSDINEDRSKAGGFFISMRNSGTPTNCAAKSSNSDCVLSSGANSKDRLSYLNEKTEERTSKYQQSQKVNSVKAQRCDGNGETLHYSAVLKNSDVLTLASNPPPPPEDKNRIRNGKHQMEPVKPIVSEEKRKKAQMYLQYRGAGWKKDIDGKWIRDEDAEFDSDEEPPDLP